MQLHPGSIGQPAFRIGQPAFAVVAHTVQSAAAEPRWCTAPCDPLKSDEKAECAKCGCSNCKGQGVSCKCQGTANDRLAPSKAAFFLGRMDQNSSIAKANFLKPSAQGMQAAMQTADETGSTVLAECAAVQTDVPAPLCSTWSTMCQDAVDETLDPSSLQNVDATSFKGSYQETFMYCGRNPDNQGAGWRNNAGWYTRNSTRFSDRQCESKAVLITAVEVGTFQATSPVPQDRSLLHYRRLPSSLTVTPFTETITATLNDLCPCTTRVPLSGLPWHQRVPRVITGCPFRIVGDAVYADSGMPTSILSKGDCSRLAEMTHDAVFAGTTLCVDPYCAPQGCYKFSGDNEWYYNTNKQGNCTSARTCIGVDQELANASSCVMPVLYPQSLGRPMYGTLRVLSDTSHHSPDVLQMSLPNQDQQRGTHQPVSYLGGNPFQITNQSCAYNTPSLDVCGDWLQGCAPCLSGAQCLSQSHQDSTFDTTKELLLVNEGSTAGMTHFKTIWWQSGMGCSEKKAKPALIVSSLSPGYWSSIRKNPTGAKNVPHTNIMLSFSSINVTVHSPDLADLLENATKGCPCGGTWKSRDGTIHRNLSDCPVGSCPGRKLFGVGVFGDPTFVAVLRVGKELQLAQQSSPSGFLDDYVMTLDSFPYQLKGNCAEIEVLDDITGAYHQGCHPAGSITSTPTSWATMDFVATNMSAYWMNRTDYPPGSCSGTPLYFTTQTGQLTQLGSSTSVEGGQLISLDPLSTSITPLHEAFVKKLNQFCPCFQQIGSDPEQVWAAGKTRVFAGHDKCRPGSCGLTFLLDQPIGTTVFGNARRVSRFGDTSTSSHMAETHSTLRMTKFRDAFANGGAIMLRADDYPFAMVPASSLHLPATLPTFAPEPRSTPQHKCPQNGENSEHGLCSKNINCTCDSGYRKQTAKTSNGATCFLCKLPRTDTTTGPASSPKTATLAPILIFVAVFIPVLLGTLGALWACRCYRQNQEYQPLELVDLDGVVDILRVDDDDDEMLMFEIDQGGTDLNVSLQFIPQQVDGADLADAGPMRFCLNCNGALNAEARFCNECGTAVPQLGA